MEHVEVLRRMRNEHSMMGVPMELAALDAAIAALSAPQPPAEAHCATCSCAPGMTPAVRFDTTPAEKEGAVRDHLIRMGWTPPAEAQPVAWEARDPDDGTRWVTRSPRERDGWRGLGRTIRPLVYGDTATSPSAPVGVEGAPIRYFAYDSDCGDYNEFDTLPEAIADAQEALDYAGDDGWPEGGPSIYYGAVLGEAREVEGSRRPAGPGDHPDADFIVEYELTGSDDLAQQPASTLPNVDDDDLTVAYMAGRHDGRKEAQQPAAVDGESVIIDGRRYGLDTVRTALLGLAADVTRNAAQQGGEP